MFIQAALVGNTKQDTYQPPFYCNFNVTCLVSVNVQMDTKKQIWMVSSWIINYLGNWLSVPALINNCVIGITINMYIVCMYMYSCVQM